MGARSGSNYLSTLKKLNAEIWLGGERVAEVTSHPALRNCARSIASLYDMQLERVEQMTYRTDDGGRAGLSFIQPKSVDELRKRSRMMTAWANFSVGVMLQTPDLVNVAIAAMASARDFFSASDPRFGDNIANYYLEARKHDWCATHLTIGTGMRLVEKTSDGIIVSGGGSIAALAPFAEELMVFPPRSVDAEAQALAFAIPCNTKGLKFECRDTRTSGRSHFDAPLSSRFDATESVVTFDNVKVPGPRVFLCGDIARCNALLDETSAGVHIMHQAVVKAVAKAEFMLGLAARLAEVTDTMTLPNVRDRIAAMSTTVATMRAYLRTAEADATPNQWGIITPTRAPLDDARTLFAQQHPRMVESIQLIGGPYLTAISSEPAPPSDAESRERAALYRLATDATSTAFAERQTPSANDNPLGVTDSLVETTDLTPLIQRIRDFLARTD
jgi:4-hydroxyphenylacetate 3-monooxygenase